jgi:Resolvase, N terminal domain
MATSRRAALYVRVSTSDRGQTVENQLQPLQEAAGRLGWTVVAISYRDEGISGTKGATSGLDWMHFSRAWRGESSTSWPRGRCAGWNDPSRT